MVEAFFHEVRRWYREALASKVVEGLQKRGFKASYVESKAEAKDRVLELIPRGSVKIGVGGSVTIRELGLIEALSERGFQVVHHWVRGLSREESYRVRMEEVNSDVFLTSVNAVTVEGELILVDGVGNRVAAAAFGPRIVIAVVGFNKIVPDLKYGMWRVRNVAMPMNARRLGLATPCASLGYCVDCETSVRGCRVTLILDRRPSMTDYHVVLVGEELGF